MNQIGFLNKTPEPTVTLTQSYSQVIHDIFLGATSRLPYFATGWTIRNNKQFPVQASQFPFLGVYEIGDDMGPHGDWNAGMVRFDHSLRIGWSVVVLNNDPVLAKRECDKAWWAIMNGIWRDQFVMNLMDTQAYGHPGNTDNPDNVRVEGIKRGSKRYVWGNPSLANEQPILELQYEITAFFGTDFPPEITDELDEIATTTGYGDPPNAVQQVATIIDFSKTHPPFETKVTLASSKTPSTVGQLVAFMGEVSALESTAPFPTGTVGLRVNGGALQNVGPLHHSGAFAIPLTLPAGVHTLVAEYTPLDADYITAVSPSIQQTVT